MHEKHVIDEMRDIYGAVGEDLYVDDHGNFNPRKTFTGDELGSIVADLFAGGMGNPCRSDDELDAVDKARKWYLALDHKSQKAIWRKAFDNKVYGY